MGHFLTTFPEMRKVESKLKSTLFTSMDPLSKEAPQIFERPSIFKNIEQNVKESSFWASCIAVIVKRPCMRKLDSDTNLYSKLAYGSENHI